MALATRCPYCRTTFRVTHDQLKLRGGLVRCGACKEIFSGVENLLPAQPVASAAPASPTQAALSAPPSPTALADSASAPAPAPETHTESRDELAATSEPPAVDAESSGRLAPEGDASPVEDRAPGVAGADPSAPAAVPAPLPAPLPASLPATTPEQDLDPLTRMTLMDMRPWPQAEPLPAQPASAPAADVDEIERALGELQQKPWRGSGAQSGEDADEIDALDNEEPDFVRQARLQAERRRKSRLVFGLGSLLLALLALLQAAILMRTEIAARWPATTPVLASLCRPWGCTIGLPQQIEYVTIESHELQALPNSDNGFVLSTLLRNRSRTAQAWPWLELTLNDAAQQPVARKVLAPADYLPAAERARGMQASSERPVRVSFTLAQLKASGYRLYVFYP